MRLTSPMINTFCGVGEVLWTCGPKWNDALFRASCRDPATNLQRFCCPGPFLSMCQ
jgi:hypothetical protein